MYYALKGRTDLPVHYICAGTAFFQLYGVFSVTVGFIINFPLITLVLLSDPVHVFVLISPLSITGITDKFLEWEISSKGLSLISSETTDKHSFFQYILICNN